MFLVLIVTTRVGLNLNPLTNVLMNLTFAKSMNLNLDFSKSMNLIAALRMSARHERTQCKEVCTSKNKMNGSNQYRCYGRGGIRGRTPLVAACAPILVKEKY